jgi:NAD(P)-dependent dehydrogenase (short-subunit alcohol dehydrogenase family)
MADLSNKVAVITGAGSGVGRAVSLELARQGVLTALCGRRPEPLNEVAAEIEHGGGRSMILPADICDEEAVEVAFERLTETAGGVDILVNCAGVGIYGPVASYSFDDWRATMETNVTGLFLCSRAALPSMQRRGGGYIVAVSSGAGRRGYANLAAYSASKFAVIGFMESLAEEVGSDGIKCTTILPGSILTDFGPRDVEEKRASGNKYLLPEDVAGTIIQILNQPAHAWTQQVNVWPF